MSCQRLCWALCLAVGGAAQQAVEAMPKTLTMMEGNKSINEVRILLAQDNNDTLTVNLTSSDEGELIIQEGADLEWGAHMWATTKYIWLYAVNDRIETGDRTVSISITGLNSTDSYYAGWPIANFDLDVTIIEDDEAGVDLQVVKNTMAENASDAASFRVMLSQEPLSDVTATVTIEPAAYATASPAVVVVTAAAWNDTAAAPLVEVLGKDDNMVRGVTGVKATVRLTQAGGVFDGAEGEVTLDRLEDDVPGLVMGTDDKLETQEKDGARDEAVGRFHFKLATAPMHDVTVVAESLTPTEGKLRTTEFVIQASSWGQWVPGEVVGIDDNVMDGDQNYTVRLHTRSNDPPYDWARSGSWGKCCEENLNMVNRDDDGFSEIRIEVLHTRLWTTDPGVVNPGLDINEVRFRDLAGNDVSFAGATATCSVPPDTPGGTPPQCPSRAAGSGPAAAIDDNLKNEWKTSGQATIAITFDKPKTLCSHAFNFGTGHESSNPYHWVVSARGEGQNAWRVLYEKKGDLAEGGPNELTDWFNWCPNVGTPDDATLPKYYDPWATLIPGTTYVPGYPTPVPPTAVPPTPVPRPDDWTPEDMTPQERLDSGWIDEDGNAPPGPDDDDSGSDLWLLIIPAVLLLLLLLTCLIWHFFCRGGQRKYLDVQSKDRDSALLGMPLSPEPQPYYEPQQPFAYPPLPPGDPTTPHATRGLPGDTQEAYAPAYPSEAGYQSPLPGHEQGFPSPARATPGVVAGLTRGYGRGGGTYGFHELGNAHSIEATARVKDRGAGGAVPLQYFETVN